jgi:hypothetical protein
VPGEVAEVVEDPGQVVDGGGDGGVVGLVGGLDDDQGALQQGGADGGRLAQVLEH